MTARLHTNHPEDFDAIRSRSDRRFVLRSIARLRDNPTYGKPLRNASLEGWDMPINLHTCRKLKLGKWRVVYRLLPDEWDVRIIDIVAVGQRKDLAVYKVAHERIRKERLGRAA